MYKFITKHDVSIQTNLKDREFRNEWIQINSNGVITVFGTNKNGYAWDGCTPKFIALDLIFGTPDGKIDEKTTKPVTYHASLFHDALYQFKSDIYLSRKEVDVIFLHILNKHEFKLKSIYFFFVRLFGGVFGSWKLSETLQEDIEVKKYFYLE